MRDRLYCSRSFIACAATANYNIKFVKDIGAGCGLKKQTMTSHLNELVKRGYLRREKGKTDRREQNIFLTIYGQQFRIALNQSIEELDIHYKHLVGEVELERLLSILGRTHTKLS